MIFGCIVVGFGRSLYNAIQLETFRQGEDERNMEDLGAEAITDLRELLALESRAARYRAAGPPMKMHSVWQYLQQQH